METLQDDVKILLRAQVLQADKLGSHDAALTRLEKTVQQLIEHQSERDQALDERISTLVRAVGALLPKQ